MRSQTALIILLLVCLSLKANASPEKSPFTNEGNKTPFKTSKIRNGADHCKRAFSLIAEQSTRGAIIRGSLLVGGFVGVLYIFTSIAAIFFGEEDSEKESEPRLLDQWRPRI